jgi:hypothetical protein
LIEQPVVQVAAESVQQQQRCPTLLAYLQIPGRSSRRIKHFGLGACCVFFRARGQHISKLGVELFDVSVDLVIAHFGWCYDTQQCSHRYRVTLRHQLPPKNTTDR